MKKLLLLFLLFSFASFSFTEKPVRKKSSKDLSRSLAFPVAGKKASIKDKWGASRNGGKRKHKGIDIHARKGTPVIAIADGIIVERAEMPIGGKTLWLKSAGHEWTAYYAHLDQQLVREGQRVQKGQVIGTVGNTGNARTTPPHLHFGIEEDGDWLNPMPYVKHAEKINAKLSVRKNTTVATKKLQKKIGVKKLRSKRR